MSPTSQQVILITGANRGIGLTVVSQLIARDNTVIIAAVRDLADSSIDSLNKLPCGRDSKVIVVKIDSTSDTDALNAVKELREQHGISRLDVVIANAGVADHYGSVVETKPGYVRSQVDINALGPLLLFQATLPLLEKAEMPKFVLIGTAIASIAGMEKRPFPMYAYGASKVIAHYTVRKIHSEHQTLIAFVVDPGFVQSRLGNEGARKFGMAEAPVTLAASASFIVEQIDGATRESVSGRFPTIEGGFFEW